MVVVSTPKSPDHATCDGFFFVSKDESGFEREPVLMKLERLNDNRWRLFTAFPLEDFRHVSRSGSGARIAAV